MSLASMILSLRGLSDPKSALIGSLLGGTSQPGGSPTAQPTSAAYGVRTPAPGAAPAGAPAPGAAPAPPRSTLYDSPPDLLSLYNQLSDYQSREKRIDSGLGLLAGAVVQPRNAGLVANMFGGNGDNVDPFTLITQVQSLKQAQQDRATKLAQTEQMRASIPAISKEYGISEETANMLLDNGSLDQFILEAAKPDNQVVTDDSTGKQFLINKKTGTKTEIGVGGLKPTSDKQNYDAAIADGSFKGGFDEWLTEDANRKAPKTTVTTNVDTAGSKALLSAFDKNLTDPLAALPDSATSITATQQGRAALSKGVIAGSVASPAILEGRKLWASAFGLDDKATQNSDEFVDAMKTQVLPKLKTLYPASDTDVKYLEGMTAATLTQHPEVLNRIIDKIEIGERKKIIDTNAKMQKRIDSESDPASKAQLQAAFDAQKTTPPAYDDVYLSHVNKDDLAELKKDPSPDNVKQFNDVYGPGVAEQILGVQP